MEVLRLFAFIAGPQGPASAVTAQERAFIVGFFETFFPRDVTAFFLARFEERRREQAAAEGASPRETTEAFAQRLNQRLDYPEKIFCLLTLYGFLASDRTQELPLRAVRSIAALLRIENRDLAFIEHHFGLAEAPARVLARSNILALNITGDPETADVYLPFPGLDLVVYKIQTTYCIHKKNDLYKVTAEGINLRHNFSTRISQHVGLHIEDHSLRYHDLLLHFRNKVRPLEASLYLAQRGVELRITPERPENALARVDIHGSHIILSVLNAEQGVITRNGQPVHTWRHLTLNDVVHCNGFRLDPRELFYSVSGNQEVALPEDAQDQDQEEPGLVVTNDIKGDIFIQDALPDKWTARLRKEAHGWRFVPLTCPYQAYVNGHARAGSLHLAPGQTLFIHNAFLTPQANGRTVRTRLFSFRHLVADRVTYRFGDGDPALDEISFSVDYGEMACIMGPSGCGKSTLLKALCGLLTPDSGTVKLDSFDLHRQFPRLRDYIGYVPQEDLLLPNLTVWENLYYHARLRFPELPRPEVEARLDAVLASIRLRDKKHQRVGALEDAMLSGGERKRLHIGLELLAGAAVYFLDEPTSGLSSSDSDNIMELLADIALSGKIVVAVIHQPSSRIYKSFDKACILDHGGRLAFFGPPSRALEYFQHHDVPLEEGLLGEVECPHCKRVQPESLLQVMEESLRDIDGALLGERKYSPLYWKRRFRRTVVSSWVRSVQLPMQHELPPARVPSSAERWTQFLTLAGRTFRHKMRDRANLGITFLAAPLLALGAGFIMKYTPGAEYSLYTNDLFPSFLFVAVISTLFLSLTNSVDEVIGDGALFLRERMLHIPRRLYLTAKLLVLMCFAVLQNVLFVLSSFLMLEVRELYWEYVVALTCLSLCGVSLGLCISSVPKLSSRAALNTAPLALIPQIILGGALIEYERMNRDLRFSDSSPIPEICQIMPSRWAYEGLVVLQETRNSYDTTHDAMAAAFKAFKYKRETLIQTRGEAWYAAHEAQMQQDLDSFRQSRKHRHGNKNIHDAVSLGEQRRKDLDADGRADAAQPLFVRAKPVPGLLAWLPGLAERQIPTPIYNMLVLLFFSLVLHLASLGLLHWREALLTGRWRPTRLLRWRR
ncbi:putative ABC-type multidrug transport system, ATPase component [Megalodesulfovibrio gigas DSM 1382 = ATCC 19364]|uniref:Putative ABC-type multidrug transport system, ATPase component n=2 Tax=Megalodesulfovibrio gigas TaxID=879 RepID=T2G772_MEGG1|nr:putative ABC-type multidrug transport system, ATPase component [Megalodesulfovibrio gigas DSM 1382 = ATCC 19364]